MLVLARHRSSLRPGGAEVEFATSTDPWAFAQDQVDGPRFRTSRASFPSASNLIEWRRRRWHRGELGPQRLSAVIAHPAAQLRRALINGAAGVIFTLGGQPMTVMGFTVTEATVAEIDAIADPDRVRRMSEAVLADFR